jgi:ribonuclease P protein component
VVTGGQRFPKSLRLRTRPEFLRVQDKGEKVAQGPLLALALRNGRDQTRLGLTVSTKVGNAVVRVRLRRQLRELYRRRRGEWPSGLDVVLIARSSAAGADYDTLAKAFDGLANRLRKLFP